MILKDYQMKNVQLIKKFTLLLFYLSIVIFSVNAQNSGKKTENGVFDVDSGFVIVNNYDLGDIGLDLTPYNESSGINTTQVLTEPLVGTASVTTSTITLQPGPDDGKDAYVYYKDIAPSLVDANFSTQEYIYCGAYTDSGLPKGGRGLIEFDFSFLASASSVIEAKLSLFHYGGAATHGSGDEERRDISSFYLRRITESWSESTVTWNTQPAATPIHQVAVSAPATFTSDFVDIDVTQLVKDMVEYGNNGFQIILQVESTYRSLWIGSSENTYDNGENRPKLEITYEGETSGGSGEVTSVNGLKGDVILRLSNSSNGTNRTMNISATGEGTAINVAGTTINVADNDNDSSNEIQTLAISGDQLTISNGNTITIPTGSGTNNCLWDDNSSYISYTSGNVAVGSDTLTQDLHVYGTMYSKEVVVQTDIPTPDYVFDENYSLKSLEELETFIKENKHLPEIPSAKEVKANGVDLGMMNMLLLKKVEELTLHLIDLQKKFELQNQMIDKQNKKIEKLEQKTK